jgi:peptide/nickel transport system ATP-binding protein
MTGQSDPVLLRVSGLSKHFQINRGLFQKQIGVTKAVDGVDLDIKRGEILGLVGESGSGKSTLGRLVLRLIEPDQGRVIFDGTELLTLDPLSLRRFRRRMQMVFQDPNSSLNPRMTVNAMLREALGLHGLATGREDERIRELIALAELPADSGARFPHEFSGGQRQRLGLIRALAVEPELIVADEPVSALDLSVQAQILEFIVKLRRDFTLTMLFISHDLDVVELLADQIAVMYLGRIVERAPAAELFSHPHHPYTKALIAASPKPDPRLARRDLAMRDQGPLGQPPTSGCAFRARCLNAHAACADIDPILRTIGLDHQSACIL